MTRTIPRWTPALASLLGLFSLVTALSGQVFVGTPVPPQFSAQGQPSIKNGEWPHYNSDIRGTRYSPLDQITGANFSKLEVAWRFKTDSRSTRKRAS
jgi:glucose dehydrogenase